MPSQADIVTNRLEIDPDSGYLCAATDCRTVGIVTEHGIVKELVFGPARKTLFVSALKKHFPNVVTACDEVGISYSTYRNHYRNDPLFREHCDNLAVEAGYILKEYSLTLGRTKPFAFLDRIASLKVLLPDEYNPANKVTITHEPNVDPEKAKQRMASMSNAIDAEIVKDAMTLERDGDPQDLPDVPRGTIPNPPKPQITKGGSN